MKYNLTKYHKLLKTYNHGMCGLVTKYENKCFLISILYCLIYTFKLSDLILTNNFIEKEQNTILYAYIELLNTMWSENKLIKINKLVKFCLAHPSFEKYNLHFEEDSHEFLLQFLNIIFLSTSYKINIEITGNVMDKSDQLVKQSMNVWYEHFKLKYSNLNIFDGMTLDYLNCKNCSYESHQFNPFLTISLNIPSTATTLDNLLQHSFQKENVEEWKCEKCTQIGGCNTTSLWNLGDYLILHLSRFQQSNTTISKNKQLIQFDLDNINLTPYVSPLKNDKNNYIYSVYAINYHSGNLDSGHYWSACRTIDDNWYMFNEGNVSKISNTNLVTNNAYILFLYRKFI